YLAVIYSCYAVCYILLSFTAHPPPVTSPLSLHAALPICWRCTEREIRRWARASSGQAYHLRAAAGIIGDGQGSRARTRHSRRQPDRKSTRLNSSHLGISYAVFCLKKKKNKSALQSETTVI